MLEKFFNKKFIPIISAFLLFLGSFGIYTVGGDLVKICKKKAVVDISDLESGSYILRIIVNGEYVNDMLFIKQ